MNCTKLSIILLVIGVLLMIGGVVTIIIFSIKTSNKDPPTAYTPQVQHGFSSGDLNPDVGPDLGWI